MSKSTISTFELFQMFPDGEAARVSLTCSRSIQLTLVMETLRCPSRMYPSAAT